MYDQHNVPPPEYRVRPVVRYVVTRFCHPYTFVAATVSESFSQAGSSSVICEVPTENGAYEIATAIAKMDGGTIQPE